MKKQLIMSVLFLILLGSFARAQNNIGIRMGYSNSSAKIDALTDLNVDQYRESGLNVAVFTDIPLGYGLYFQPEIVYNQMGFGGRESMDIELLGLEIPAEARISTTVDYIQLPLQLKYQFNESVWYNLFYMPDRLWPMQPVQNYKPRRGLLLISIFFEETSIYPVMMSIDGKLVQLGEPV